MRDTPGSPVIKNLPRNAGGMGSIPCQGTKIPRATQPKKKGELMTGNPIPDSSPLLRAQVDCAHPHTSF